MIPKRQVVLAAALIWLAAVAQGRAAHALSVHGVQPDLRLVVLACGALLVGGPRGTLLGFWTGLLTAAAAPGLYGSLFLSRLMAGALAGGVGRSLIGGNFLVPPLVTLAATLVAEAVTVVLAPGLALHHIRHWLWLAGGGALYNSLLALPASLLLRVLGVGRPREDPFGRLS